MSVDSVFELIRSESLDFSTISGVTFSGGEPFDQADALAILARRLREHRLNLLAFSGYKMEEIQKQGGCMAGLLGELDILIDGEYIESLSEKTVGKKLLWRGSANQRIHLLTNQSAALESHLKETTKDSGDFDIIVNQGSITITGFPDPRFLSQFSRQ